MTTATKAVSIGHSSMAGAEDAAHMVIWLERRQLVTLALGATASATEVNSVALGASSATAAAVNTGTMTISGKSYTLAGGTADGTVSIGSSTQNVLLLM